MPADWSQEKGMGVVHRNYNLKTIPARGYPNIAHPVKHFSKNKLRTMSFSFVGDDGIFTPSSRPGSNNQFLFRREGNQLLTNNIATNADRVITLQGATAGTSQVAAEPRVPPVARRSDNQGCDAHNDLSQLPVLRERVRTYVNHVVRTMLPFHQSQAYLQALAKDPELIRIETDPLQFVRFCNFDLWAGAQRLCRYWTERLKLFGPQRAFLPLTLTGTGALTPEDVVSIQAGYPAILPDTSNGQKCIWIDRRNWIPTASFESRLRSWFFIHRVLAEDDRTHKPGDNVLFLIVAVTPRRDNVEWEFVERLTALGAHCFPDKPRVHFLCIPNQKRYAMAPQVVQGGMSLFRKLFADGIEISTHVHVQNDDHPIYEDLVGLGLTAHGILVLFGGEWKLDDWTDWCLDRMKWERDHYKDRLLKQAPIINDDCTSNETSAKMNQNPSAAGERRNREESEPATTTTVDNPGKHPLKPEAQKRRKRSAKRKLADLMFSRRKRERERQEILMLQ